MRHEVMHDLASTYIIFAYSYIINSDVTGKLSVRNPLMPLIHKKLFEAVIRTSCPVSTQRQSTSLCILLLCIASLVPWPLKNLFS